MVELVWEGKKAFSAIQQQIEQRSQLYSFVTTETYPTQEAMGTSHPSFPCEPPWANRLIQGDKDVVLPALLDEFTARVDLIYIDPPFMTGRTFSVGSHVAFSDTWGNSLADYLSWLQETCIALYLLLAPDGTLYVHLDWRTAPYARILLDEIFQAGPAGGGFKNEIIWHYQSGGRAQRRYARKHDTLLLYTKSAQYCFHGERVGERRGIEKRNHMRKVVDDHGRVSWTIHSAGRVYSYDEDTPLTPSDVWSDINHLHQRDPERRGYATQKPEALLERVILASSEEGDLVLDCFCGSGVTPATAERLRRRWIAADQSELAVATTRERLLIRDYEAFLCQSVTNRSRQTMIEAHP